MYPALGLEEKDESGLQIEEMNARSPVRDWP
jgi:hypothetical protein